MTEKAARFFVSYRHGDPDEERLAEDLTRRLGAEGYETFLDKAMTVGTDWVAEIDERLAWCDHLVVLLSEAAMASEMVQGEVRKAVQRRQREGQPSILPVRMRYFGPLEYELESYLSRIQYARWESAADSSRVIDEILAACRGGSLPQAHSRAADRPTVLEEGRRPLPRVDPRSLTAPGGSLRADDPLYLERAADTVAGDLAKKHGVTLVVKAPRQMGKSSLLIRYLVASRNAGVTTAFIDFQVLSQDDFASYPAFLTRLAAVIHRALRLERSLLPASIATQQDFTWFMEDAVLAVVKGPLVLAFDEVDRLLGRTYQGDFFTMLRLWHNNRSDPTQDRWSNVSLALVISTEPYLLITEADRSPFNVGTTIELKPFSSADCQRLNAAHGSILSERQVNDLWQLIEGHPYLTRLAFYRLTAPDAVGFDALVATAAEDRGPFGEHLRAMLFRLHGRPQLLEGLRQIVARGTTADDDVYYRLFGAGLVRRDAGRIAPANRLYAQFFTAVL